MSWLLDNAGKVAIIDVPATRAAPLLLASIRTDGGAEIVKLANLRIQSASHPLSVGYRVAKALDGKLYFQAFGEDHQPVEIKGVVVADSCTASNLNVFKQMVSFFNTYKADGLGSWSTVRVTLGRTYSARCLLVNLQVQYAPGVTGVEMLGVVLTLIPLETFS